jgi:predicted ATPase/DNA-binding winged helix-turn-helix (wHTH) protein
MSLASNPPLARCRFGRFELLAASRELLQDGRPLAIGNRAFDVLLTLVERRPRLVSKDELLDRVWPNLVVEEGNLHVQVSTLRKLLGAQAITTVPGRGYRFELPMHDSDPPAAAPPPQEPASRAVPARATHNLPASPGTLHGRDNELQALGALVSARRLVTVVGPGGIGKTRLALAVAQGQRARVADGVWWIELAPINDGQHLAPTLAGVLGLDLAGATDVRAALLRALATLDTLVVLDNCEHMMAEVTALLREGLKQAPKTRWLVTTQEPLKLALEDVYRLDALPVPPERATPEQAMNFGAMALLVERARAATRRFELTQANVAAAIAICRELDGNALAIEVAAARVPLLGLAGVQQKLGERLRLLNVPGGLFRSQTLRGALDWSHSLLSAHEQVAFRRLAVFVGGFSLALAQEVAADATGPDGLDEWTFLDALGALVDKSLVIADGQDEPRYRLLEITRAYALERLAQAGETDALKRRHALAMAKEVEQCSQSAKTLPEAQWRARALPEFGNLRAAFDHALAAGLVEAAATLAIEGFTTSRHLEQFAEGRQRLESVRPLLDRLSPELAARACFAMGDFGDSLSEGRLKSITQALDRFRALGDNLGVYRSAAVCAELLARNGRSDEAQAMLAEAQALEDPAWPPRVRSIARNSAAFVAEVRGEIDAAARAMREAIALDLAAGWESRVAAKLSNLAAILLGAGRIAESIGVGEELLALQASGHAIPGLAYMNLAGALILDGRLTQARETSRIGLPLMQRKGQAYIYVDHLALLAAKEGRTTDAARLLGWTDRMYEAQRTRRDMEEAQARALALQLVDAATTPEARAQAMREGAQLSEDAAVALALAPP